jgi:type IV secretion system protein VirD4
MGSVGRKLRVTALVDTDDVHAMMIAASGAGKTAYFLYPNIEYACACGMSFLCTDTKGDLFRNYANIAKDRYGYNVAVIDLRNPTRSDGYNMLHLVNKYMDAYAAEPEDLALKAKAEKYAKIISKTVVNSSGDNSSYGQNAFFYDAAEGLLTSVFLLLAEYITPSSGVDKRHIISAFKLVQDLLAPSKVKGKSQFQLLIDKLPPEHKARMFAGAALNSAEQAMQSVISTVLSRLNAFLDSEMEQILCFDTSIDTEKFCTEKSALFVVLPEEDTTKYFMVSLMLQSLYREILTVADDYGGKLPNRCVFFLDEIGTIPPIESLELMFSASRSRRLTLVPILQSITGQLVKNYGKEGAEIIVDNCQDVIFGGFAPNSQTAPEMSKALGSYTAMSGSVSRGKNDPSQSLQMIERPLLTADELKTLPKGEFVVMKTGTRPMRTRLRLFLDWGITFGEPYNMPERASRKVAYAGKDELERAIIKRHYTAPLENAEYAEIASKLRSSLRV